jgi:hypothetical protein
MSVILKGIIPPSCLLGARHFHTMAQAEEATTSVNKVNKAAFRMGVVADIQCCDIEDGFNYARTVQRRYRGALQMLDKAVGYWNEK